MKIHSGSIGPPLREANAPSRVNVKFLNVIEAEPVVIPAASYVEPGVTSTICQGLVKVIVTGVTGGLALLDPLAEAAPKNWISPTTNSARAWLDNTPEPSKPSANTSFTILFIFTLADPSLINFICELQAKIHDIYENSGQ